MRSSRCSPTRELEDQVTLRDVAHALQRAEMLRRIADSLEGYVVELGAEGRMIALQLEELFEPDAAGARADRA
jgi:diadenylate cyclase